MKPKTILYAMVAAAAAVFVFSQNHLTAQSDTTTNTPAVTQLMQEVQAQEATMADNQKQIDDKMAAVQESLRTARIFVSRGGGPK